MEYCEVIYEMFYTLLNYGILLALSIKNKGVF